VPRLEEIIDRLDALRLALPESLLRRVEVARSRLEALEQSYALRHPEERVTMLRQRLDDLASVASPACAVWAWRANGWPRLRAAWSRSRL